MNIGEPLVSKKKSMLDFMFKGIRKIGFGKLFGEENTKNEIIYNLRKNSKSERVILKSEALLGNSEESSERESSSSEDQKDFSKELEM